MREKQTVHLCCCVFKGNNKIGPSLFNDWRVTLDAPPLKRKKTLSYRSRDESDPPPSFIPSSSVTDPRLKGMWTWGALQTWFGIILRNFKKAKLEKHLSNQICCSSNPDKCTCSPEIVLHVLWSFSSFCQFTEKCCSSSYRSWRRSREWDHYLVLRL